MNALRNSILFVAVLAVAGCGTSTPYWEGDGPALDGVSPDLDRNGNLGGAGIEHLVVDVLNPTEDEAELLADYIVTISGSFGGCAGEDGTYSELRAQFGARNARILAVRDDAVQVLTPAGPVSGGRVDVSVSCDFGASVLKDAYDYALADPVAVDEDGAEARRLEDLFPNEYASFSLQYGAEPFINQPEPYGYGFFFNQPAPRSSTYYGGNPGMMYAGEANNTSGSVLILPQIPEIPFEAPEQGSRVRAGDGVTFFRERNTSDPFEVLTTYARKRPQTNSFLDPNTPDAHTPLSSNNGGAWFGIPYSDDEGISRVRYLRIGNDIGRVCAPFNAEDPLAPGCSGDEGKDDAINDTRIPVDARWKWMVPDRPGVDELANYPTTAPERVAFLNCVDAAPGVDEDAEAEACAASTGIMLPSGTYNDAFICRSFDEDEDFPWEEDGFCIIIEVVGDVVIEEGGHYIDIPQVAQGTWTLDPDSNFYGGAPEGIQNAVGENVLVRGIPVFVSYNDGFYAGDLVPAKNPEMTVPAQVPPPMGFICMDDGGDLRDSDEPCNDDESTASSFDETPYVEVAPIEYGTFFSVDSPFGSYERSDGRVFGGFPILFDQEIPVDLRISLPGGITQGGTDRSDEDMRVGGWDDTYITITLEVRDIDRPGGLDYDAVWRATAWAWAGDDYITFPAETLATMPDIGDIFRPDSEDQKGAQFLGIIRLQVHRTASWRLGDEFRDQAGRAVFDVSAETVGYFHNQHSCFDGLDNDGDGLCDVSGCDVDTDGDGEPDTRLEGDPACTPPNVGDDQPEYETAVCSDGEDNDNDGLVDMEDPDCTDPNDSFEDSACLDGVDNDGDGWIDYPNDPGCTEATAQDEGGYSYLTDCNDGVDDDGDGRIDADDPGCENALDDDESDVCGDGLDNNQDGWIDWADLTCRPGALYPGGENDTYLLGAEGFECSDSDLVGAVDNDGDGFANVDDPECLFGWDPSGEGSLPAACEDNIDNDCDGWIDALDPGCASNPLSESLGGDVGGSCANGVDDDSDGWIDALDPDCLSGADDEMALTTPLECNDGIDNDGDNNIDGDDADCWTGKDNHEGTRANDPPEPAACVPNQLEDLSCINIVVVLPNEAEVALFSSSCDTTDLAVKGRTELDASVATDLNAVEVNYGQNGCSIQVISNHCAEAGTVPLGLLGASVTVDLTTCFGVPEEYAQEYLLDAGSLVVNDAAPTQVGPGSIIINDQSLMLDADLSGTSSGGLEVYGVLNVDTLGTVIDSVAPSNCN